VTWSFTARYNKGQTKKKKKKNFSVQDWKLKKLSDCPQVQSCEPSFKYLRKY